MLDDCGIASHLSALTRKDLTTRYAYFLSFLAHRGTLDLQGPGAATVTEENILHYLRYLEPRLSSVTLAQSLYKIARVAHFLAPGRDWRWLRALSVGSTCGPSRATSATRSFRSRNFSTRAAADGSGRKGAELKLFPGPAIS